MEIKEITSKLLEEGYLVLVSGKPILTAKFERELGHEDKAVHPTVEGVTKVLELEKNVIIKPTTYTDDLKEIWNAFILDCELPHRVSDNRGGTYTIRQYSKGIAGRLKKIIADPKTDYTRLVESTKHYYKTVSYKSILSNYIDKEIWLSEYELWNTKIKKDITTGGGNPFEK